MAEHIQDAVIMHQQTENACENSVLMLPKKI